VPNGLTPKPNFYLSRIENSRSGENRREDGGGNEGKHLMESFPEKTERQKLELFSS